MAKKNKDAEEIERLNKEVARLNFKVGRLQVALEEERREKLEDILNKNPMYMTLGEFIEDYTNAMRSYLSSSFRDNGGKYHPEDLVSNAATFADAVFYASEILRDRSIRRPL